MFKVQAKEVDGTKFHYVDVGSERHEKVSFRLWLSSKLVKGEKLEFPIYNAAITKTEKGNLVLKPADDTNVLNILVPAGFRGAGSFTIEEPENVEAFYYSEFRSPKGNLGVDEGALVNVPADADLKYRWSRFGRLYGSPSEGFVIVKPWGEVIEVEGVEPGDLEDIENNLT